MKEIILALLFTIIIEAAILLLIRKKDLIKYSILINILTNISLNLLLMTIKNFDFIFYFIILLILEVIICFIEGYLYNKIIKNNRLSLRVSFILNSSSFVIGTIILNILLIYI